MTTTRAVFFAMLAKDLRRELRSKEVFISSFLFSLILLTIIYYATTAGGLRYESMAGGAFWLCLIFSATIGLNRTHQAEMENGCYRALILYPVDSGWLYLAKALTNFLLLAIMAALLFPLIWIFFQLDPDIHYGYLAASLGLGLAAFSAIGTLVVVIAANTRMKDVLFPVIQLPLVVPVLIAGVNSTEVALQGDASLEGIKILIAMNLVFPSLGFLLYEFLLEE